MRFPNLSSNGVIVPGTVRLAFEIELNSSKDANKTLYQSIGRAMIKKTTIRISGMKMSIDDSDICHCYVDLWKFPSELINVAHQGIGGENMI